MGAAYRTYAFLHARLGAMKAELIDPVQWQQLLSAESFEEQKRQLAATCYAPWLRATREETLSRVRNAVYPAARKIERSVPSRAARLIHAWASRDVLRNLKTVLNGKAVGAPEEQIRSELLELDPMYSLPIEPLLGCSSLEAAFDILETTPLKHWIRTVRRIHHRDPTLFGLSAALDRLYYPEVCQQLPQLPAGDRAAVWRLLRLEIDQVNLVWLLRYRLNYGLSPAETYYLLVPVTGLVGDDRLKALVPETSLSAVVSRLRPRWLSSLMSPCQTIWQVEVAMWRQRARVARQMLISAAFTLGEALALLVLKVVEVRNLVALLSGRAFGAGQEEIETQLAGIGTE